LILCSGKIYTDLATSDQRAEHPEIALVRLEQLYPFPYNSLSKVLDRYPSLEEVLWVQEEPQNMGAWEFVYPRLLERLGDRWPLHYVGRPRRASPAEGSSAWHAVNQAAIIAQAFSPDAHLLDETDYETVQAATG
jgi:2-oxoglutarate dehydrogenase E1 component